MAETLLYASFERFIHRLFATLFGRGALAPMWHVSADDSRVDPINRCFVTPE